LRTLRKDINHEFKRAATKRFSSEIRRGVVTASVFFTRWDVRQTMTMSIRRRATSLRASRKF
jgi:hypothetical protein